MNQTPLKQPPRQKLKPVVLPKRCASPKGLVVSTVVTVILLVISLMILSVALLVGASDVSEQDASSGKKHREKVAEAVEDTRPKIAITFDDGPHNGRTKQIVDELNKYGYHATFFVIGNRVDGTEYNGREALQYAVANGNEIGIGIHGYTHQKYYNKCTEEEYQYELSATQNAINRAASDASVRLMRPPGGSITAERVTACPYSVVLWDIDSEDWKHKSRENEEVTQENINAIVENVLSSAHEGGIILMHDIYENTFEATVLILKALNEQGYNVVSVSELLGDAQTPGRKYSSFQQLCLPLDFSTLQCYNKKSKNRNCEALF